MFILYVYSLTEPKTKIPPNIVSNAKVDMIFTLTDVGH